MTLILLYVAPANGATGTVSRLSLQGYLNPGRRYRPRRGSGFGFLVSRILTCFAASERIPGSDASSRAAIGASEVAPLPSVRGIDGSEMGTVERSRDIL